MTGPEGENNVPEMSIEAKVVKVKSIIDGLLKKINSEIKATEAQLTNIRVEGGRIMTRDRDLVHLTVMKSSIVSARNEFYELFDLKIPVEEESPEQN